MSRPVADPFVKGDFAAALLAWFDVHGRHDLPWQLNRSAYTVWVSEIMLQQTQVTTVIGYFEKFISKFPDVSTLANAPLDDVLALWAGLGYYARARNLHKAAGVVRDAHDGIMPADIESLIALPGIGRSTAGAIASLAWDKRAPILDGNVKRVLSRRVGMTEWPGGTQALKQLWLLAEELTPHERVADYTQAIMDLGATLCTRAKPLCMHCPVSEGCVALRDGLQGRIPAPKPKVHRPRRSVRMLVLQNTAGAVLLERRPAAGVWPGLFSLPELPEDTSAGDWSRAHVGSDIADERALAPISHAFTHFDLDIEPLRAMLSSSAGVLEHADRLWYKPGEPQRPGMPAPVARLLDTLA